MCDPKSPANKYCLPDARATGCLLAEALLLQLGRPLLLTTSSGCAALRLFSSVHLRITLQDVDALSCSCTFRGEAPPQHHSVRHEVLILVLVMGQCGVLNLATAASAASGKVQQLTGTACAPHCPAYTRVLCSRAQLLECPCTVQRGWFQSMAAVPLGRAQQLRYDTHPPAVRCQASSSAASWSVTSKKSSILLFSYCGGLLMVSHILCTSSLRTSTSFSSGVFDLSRMTNSSTVRRRLGSGAKSLRLTCSQPNIVAGETKPWGRRRGRPMKTCIDGYWGLMLLNLQMSEFLLLPQASIQADPWRKHCCPAVFVPL